MQKEKNLVTIVCLQGRTTHNNDMYLTKSAVVDFFIDLIQLFDHREGGGDLLK